MEEKILENQAVEVEAKPGKNWFKIATFLVLSLVLAGGLVFAGYKFGQREVQPIPTVIPSSAPKFTPVPKISPTPLPTLTSELTPTPDPTADWETYTNAKYGYSIKFPSGVQVQEGQGYEERIQETIFTFFGPKYQGPGEWTDGFGITLAVIKNPNQKTPSQFAQEYYKQAEEDIRNKFMEGDISKCKVETVVKSSVVGAKFTYCTQAPGSGIDNFSEWYINEGKTYQIYAVLQNENYRGIFNLMLSTFRFLE